VLHEQQLHFLGADLLPAAVNDVLDPSLHRQVPLAADGADRDQVAGAVEAVAGERPGVVLGSVEVAAKRVRAGAAQLTDLPVVDLGLDLPRTDPPVGASTSTAHVCADERALG
jgi:hypothetical protein